MNASAIEGFNPALERTGLLLFKPFRFKKWLGLSLAAALTMVGEGGFNFPWNIFTTPGRRPARRPGAFPPPPRDNFAQSMEKFATWMQVNAAFILTIVAITVVLGTALYLLSRWLSARGQFIFMDNIVGNEDKIKEPWAKYKYLGNSLFKFRLMWDLAWFNLYLILLVIAGTLAWQDFKAGLIAGDYPFTAWSIWAIVVAVGGFLLTLPFVWFAYLFFFCLVIPVMYARQIPAWPAFKETWREIFWPNKGGCLLYFLMLTVVQMVTGFWASIAFFVFGMVTCCIGYLLFYIPFVGTFVVANLALPPVIFARAYSLYFISQFGEQYRIAWATILPGGFPVLLNNPPPDNTASGA